MKIYMKTRNEQMKKLSHDNRKLSLSSSQNGKRSSSTSANNFHLNKRLKPTAPSHDSKKHSIQPPVVRFINKTTNSKINSASPTTPASSSSTLSPPLIVSISNNIKKQNQIPSVDDDNDELDLELNIDELFNDDSYSEQTVKNRNERINTSNSSQTK